MQGREKQVSVLFCESDSDYGAWAPSSSRGAQRERSRKWQAFFLPFRRDNQWRKIRIREKRKKEMNREAKANPLL